MMSAGLAEAWKIIRGDNKGRISGKQLSSRCCFFCHASKPYVLFDLYFLGIGALGQEETKL